ncbi:CcgAII protein [Klebsiella pneumoniae]|uniref:CcgAII protein n=1 Tax=Enterobacter cloacae TaxID=550 RepID=A0A0P0L3Y0_ENTCL|nr:hypothetical protein [Enterobacter cloacae]MCF1918639.1 CcgAII protein [Klebsiella pneumoniae]STR56923.1 Uncharacterised protein [Klebsiella pneumoniae]VCZ15498.1 hypothetical protein BANRA_05152 [Klebsiella pneumoniae]
MTTQTLEQTLEDFRRQCESFAREQQPRCGLIYELYQRRLSADIDGYLAGVPAEYREELIAVARREFDYLTQDEIAEEIRQDRENDYCSHGIERNCCPLGCGDLGRVRISTLRNENETFSQLNSITYIGVFLRLVTYSHLP